MKKDLVISSSQNAVFKTLKELDHSRGIKKHHQFFLMGEKLIQEFLQDHSAGKDYTKAFHIEAEVLSEKMMAQASAVQKIILSPELFDEIDVVGTHSNLLLLKFSALEKKPLQPPAGLELISPLGDPSNLGALSRSALAFGAKKIILTEESCHPFHPKAVKSSAGACLKIQYLLTESLEKLSSTDSIYLLDQHGQSLKNFSWPKSMHLLIGEEGPGFRRLKNYSSWPMSQKISVPTKEVESLNATVAASCALFDYRLKN